MATSYLAVLGCIFPFRATPNNDILLLKAITLPRQSGQVQIMGILSRMARSLMYDPVFWRSGLSSGRKGHATGHSRYGDAMLEQVNRRRFEPFDDCTLSQQKHRDRKRRSHI